MSFIKRIFSDYLKEVIYGGIDGIVTTFAVVAGFAGATLSNETTTQLSFLVVLLFGLANLFADASSMGLGNFLSVRSDKQLYISKRNTERNQRADNLAQARRETVTALTEQGFDIKDATAILALYEKNPEFWLDFSMQYEHSEIDPRGENEAFTGLATFISFLIFGSVPLLPFMLQSNGDPKLAFTYSVFGTFAALLLLGTLKWRVIGAAFFASIFEVVAVGGTAAILAYIVGTFFAL